MVDVLSLVEKKTAFELRTVQYLKLGLDRFSAAEFVVSRAKNLVGPALDIGTGKGLTALALARCGLEVASLDVDPDEQELASLLAEEAGLREQIHFVRGNAGKMKFANEQFGCVAMMDALHHLACPTLVLDEITRVLKPNGVLILADFTSEGFDLIAQVHREEGHEHSRDGLALNDAANCLIAKGFVLQTKDTGHFHEVAVLIKER